MLVEDRHKNGLILDEDETPALIHVSQFLITPKYVRDRRGKVHIQDISNIHPAIDQRKSTLLANKDLYEWGVSAYIVVSL